jgi:hypothetical protein
VDIGPPRRIIEVEPISLPLPVDLPTAEPVPVEAPVEPQPADRPA